MTSHLRRANVIVPLCIALVLVVIAVLFTQNPLFLVGAAIAVAIGLFAPARLAWDRLMPDSGLQPPSAQQTGTVERYFQVWLTEYGREQALFATVTDDNAIPTRFRDERRMIYDNINEVVEYYPRFVLIGEPGEGKSTALKTLMAQAIFNHRRSNGQTQLPLWINMGLSDNPVEAEQLIGYWWYEQHHLPGNPDVYLNRDGLVLYLDGLNEMPEHDGTRKERAASLRRFLQKHPNIAAIVTCRVREYEDDQDLNLGLPVLRVQQPTEKSIRNFINIQLGSTELWDVIAANPKLMQLAYSPYRLRMLMDIYQARGEMLPLPEDLQTLSDTYVKLRYEGASHKLRTQSWEELAEPLHKLAYRITIQGRGTAVSLRWAQRQIGRDALKDAFDLRLMRREAGVARFYNHTLHGYFAIPNMLNALENGDTRERITPRSSDLIQYIGDLGEPAAMAVPALTAALQDQNRLVRQVSAFALGRIGEPAASAVPSLVEVLRDEKQDVREFAAFALGRIGESAAPAVPILIPALQDANPVVRLGAALALRQVGTAAAPAISALITALKDANHTIIQLAALALGGVGENAALAVPELVQLLNHEKEDVRFAAAYSLGQIGEPAVVVLQETLTRNKPETQIPAAQALGEMGKSAASAVPMLANILPASQGLLRQTVVRALERINTPQAQEALRLYYEQQSTQN